MACEWPRGKLDAYVDGELAPADARALSAHLRECSACAAEALERVQMKRSVASAGKRYEPSAALRARIAKTAGAKPKKQIRWQWIIVAAPALVVVVASLLVIWHGDREKARQQRVYSELTDLHVGTLASAAPVDVVSTDRHTVKPWFQGKIPFTFNLPELQGSEFTLIGGRVTYLEQAPGAHLIYQFRKHEISVFIFQERADAPTSLSPAGNVLSFNVESWAQNGLRYFVIGDVSSEQIKALSKLLRDAG
jgi:anti-sigma factor RsiW